MYKIKDLGKNAEKFDDMATFTKQKQHVLNFVEKQKVIQKLKLLPIIYPMVKRQHFGHHLHPIFVNI